MLVLAAAIVALLAAHWLTGMRDDPGSAARAIRRNAATGAMSTAASTGARATEPQRSPRRAAPLAARPVDAMALYASMIPPRYETASDFRALFDELLGTGANEGKFFAAKILVDCLDVGDDGFDVVMRRFVATVPPDSPAAAARIAAFRQLKGPCARFSGRTPSGEEIDRLVDEGARGGDVRALSQLLVTDRLDPGADAALTIARLLESGDPYALSNFATYLFAANRLPVVVGGNRVDPMDLDAAQFAWDLVVCDYGLPCGPDGKAVLHMCAHDGLCNAQTFEDLVRRELGILASFDRVEYFRKRILDALAVRDYRSLGIFGTSPTSRTESAQGVPMRSK